MKRCVEPSGDSLFTEKLYKNGNQQGQREARKRLTRSHVSVPKNIMNMIVA
jgi:hypothetical protein